MKRAIATILPKKNWLLVFVVPIGLAVFITVSFFATAQQSGQGLEVSPPSQELKADPGQTLTVKSKITNRSNSSLPIQVRVEDFTAVGNQGQVELTTDNSYSIKSWAKIYPSSFTLDRGETKEVQATINIPKDAAGGRYGSFVFGVKGDEKPGTASLTQEIASLFLVRISGPVDEKLALLEFDSPSFSEFGPIPFNIKVKNSGNVHVKTYGLINVTDMFGRKVKDVVVYETNIFPGAERIIGSTLDKKFLFGRYSATAVVYYGSTQNQSFTSTLTFYVFPIRLIAIGLVIFTIIYIFRKRLSKAIKALMGK